MCGDSYENRLIPCQAKITHRELREAIKNGTGYIDDLPPFLYIEYAMWSTAVGDLMLEHEIAVKYVASLCRFQGGLCNAYYYVLITCSREAAGYRLVRLWMWIPAGGIEFESAEQDGIWEDPEE